MSWMTSNRSVEIAIEHMVEHVVGRALQRDDQRPTVNKAIRSFKPLYFLPSSTVQPGMKRAIHFSGAVPWSSVRKEAELESQDDNRYFRHVYGAGELWPLL
ncbi:hypothetical protein RvY_03300 [Ramazzottius varieornatus]|uniref:Uncharacterized protein n=1 Tax=Ramazzottius varieornatus TaxID=947166 RepID=A0A1D1UWZ5_RAMVA|nr:hypothetical protein RvY_03300 [Ramazzottius varieornatus]